AAGRRPRSQAPGAAAITRRFRHVSYALAQAPALLGQAATFAPDIIGALAPSAAAASTALAAARVARVPAWLHLEEDAPPLGIESAFACVSLASADASARLEARGVTAAAAEPLPPWVDLGAAPNEAVRAAMRRDLGAGPDDVIALYAGWCGDERVARTVIEASRLVPPRGAIRFVAAAEGPAARLFTAAAAELPRILALRLPPPHALAQLLAVADLQLMPEGPAVSDPLIPAKLASLLASGRPVLAAPPRHGFVRTFHPVTGPRLADTVVALAAAGEERRAQGLAARRAAEDYFAMERVLRRLEQRLVRLAGR
ncbi:MAG: hypothetical protein ACREFQ_12635, partial [Stellaceae bacterium]